MSVFEIVYDDPALRCRLMRLDLIGRDRQTSKGFFERASMQRYEPGTLISLEELMGARNFLYESSHGGEASPCGASDRHRI